MNGQRSQVRSLSRRRAAKISRQRASKSIVSITPLTQHHDEWWDVDSEVLSALATGAKSPAEIGESLGMSEQSVTSLLSLLAQAGKIRIRLVEAVD
jgi:hypothetical protein